MVTKGESGGKDNLRQESPTPEMQTSTGPWPVRNWVAQQEVSSGRASEASSAAPHCWHYHLNHPPPPTPHPPSVEKLSSTKLVPGAKNVGNC